MTGTKISRNQSVSLIYHLIDRKVVDDRRIQNLDTSQSVRHIVQLPTTSTKTTTELRLDGRVYIL